MILIGARAILVACVLLIAWGAFSPPHGLQPHLFPWDKAEHFCAFFALTACAVLAFPRAPLGWIAAASSGAGALVELVQALPFVNRDSDVMDWVADTVAVGAVMGVILIARLRRGLEAQGARRAPPG